MTNLLRPATESDAPAIERLLTGNALPVDGMHDRLATTLVDTQHGRVIATAALEVFHDGAVLRSVAVDVSCRRAGAGGRLVEALLTLASERGARAVYLLTTTAEEYFPRFGFTRIERDIVPAGVRQSCCFTSSCPDSATVMRRVL